VESFDGLTAVFADPVFVERRADADRDAAARAAVFRLRAVVAADARLAELRRLGALVFERRAAMVRFAPDLFDPAFLVERLTAVFLDTRLATLCLLTRTGESSCGRSADQQRMVAQAGCRVATSCALMKGKAASRIHFRCPCPIR